MKKVGVVRRNIARAAAAVGRLAGGAEPQPFRQKRAAMFDAGAGGRLMQDWDSWTVSPEFETRYAFRVMRARARSLSRNNPWIAGFLDELANNVIGPNGIQLHAAVKNTKAELVKITNQAIEDGWKEWSYPENASADGVDSWVDLQRLMIQTIAIDGECFVRRIRGADNAFGYTLQIIDADLVDETFNRPSGPNQNRIRMGVEVDPRNRPVAYHVYSRYAEDMSGDPYERQRIPASDMLHLFVRWHRSNVPRGITWFAPVVTSVRHAGEYEFNQLVAARAGAAKMAFITNNNPAALEAFVAEKDQNAAPRMFEMEPGVIPELLPGQSIETLDPTAPGVAYGEYMSAVLGGVARGLKVSRLTLTGDLRGANYSSMRAGLLPERDRWRALQIWFSDHGSRLIYRDWIDMAALKGAVKLDQRLGSDYYDVDWHGRGWKWVDPKNDLEAAKLEIDLGLNSRTQLCGERGVDYEDIVDELADEQDYADEMGVDTSGNQVAGIIPTSVSPEGQADDASEPTDSPDAKPGARARLSAVS